MRHLLTLLLLIGCLLPLTAQTEISARVVDSTGTGLPGANAVLLRTSDSLLTAFGTTDNKGDFLIKNVSAGDYILRLSYIGFERPDQSLSISDADQYLGLGELTMYPAGYLLSSLEVTADRIPIRMKGDTMMYNAEAFAVGENAVVEDLLRRLPGMQVDASGQITWRGRAITEIMVNGKPFLAGSTTLLTQNFDADAVKNVEVFDKKTDAEEITGIDDGEEATAINLEMKDDFKAKLFGDLHVGYGTQERYVTGLKGFRISDATQLGVLGTINNTNKVGFSFDEVAEFNGSSGRGRYVMNGDGAVAIDQGDANGQNRSIAGGINFGRTFEKGGQLTMDYALLDRRQSQQARTLEAFTLADEDRTTETLQTNLNQSYSHRFGGRYEYRKDTLYRINFGGTYTLPSSTQESQAATTVFNEQSFIEDYSVDEVSRSENASGSLSGGYYRTLGRRGRSLSFDTYVNWNTRNSDLDLLTAGLDDSISLPGALINGLQTQNNDTRSLSYSGDLEFTETIRKDWTLSFSTEYESDWDKGDYHFDVDSREARNQLTRIWDGLILGSGLSRRFGRGKSIRIGLDYASHHLGLEGDATRDEQYTYLLPSARIRFRTGKSNLSLRYNTSRSAPSVSQLLTIARPNTTGRVSVGNPNLQPNYRHRLSGNWWFNDQFRGLTLYTFASASYVDQAFGNSVTLTRGQQIYQPVNVSHSWNVSLNVGSNIGLNFIKGNLQINGRYNHTIGEGFVNGNSRTNINNVYSLNTDITTEFNEQSFLTLGYDWSNSVNSFNDEENVAVRTIRHQLRTIFEYQISKTFRLDTRFFYSIYEAAAFTTNNEIADLRASLEIRPFKNNEHYFKLSGFDLLNQNLVIDRRNSDFVTTETQSDALGRFFMGAFYYKF